MTGVNDRSRHPLEMSRRSAATLQYRPARAGLLLHLLQIRSAAACTPSYAPPPPQPRGAPPASPSATRRCRASQPGSDIIGSPDQIFIPALAWPGYRLYWNSAPRRHCTVLQPRYQTTCYSIIQPDCELCVRIAHVWGCRLFTGFYLRAICP